MTGNAELTFDAVDDLVAAQMKGKLREPGPEMRFAPARLGPLLELALHSRAGKSGSLLASPWLDQLSLRPLRLALMRNDQTWTDDGRLRGFLRTVYNPLNPEDDLVRTEFLMAARRAAEDAGFSIPVAQSLAAALREMEINIHEHSGQPQTGIIAFQARHSIFEFVVGDAGVGVLATLRQAPEYQALSDHGRALHTALQEGASRHGRAANRGMGFRDLFVGLATLNADLRFRSGDHALTISGPRPELKTARLAQKPFFQGLLASVACRLPPRPHVTH